jgi:dimethylglycine dehydrogenase
MPALQDVGIHTVVNGPITYTIDGAPLVGPIPGKRNAYCIIGLRAGLGEGGGHGWLLAQQIVHGEACYDTWVLDPRRFTGHGNTELCALKAIEDYQNEFRFHFPNEHRPAGRYAKTTPLTPVLEAEGAEFTVVNGWERAEFFKPSPEFHVTPSFKFDEAHEIVGAEVAAVQNAVGLTEVNGFNRMEISGADARSFLDRMSCSKIKSTPGRISLAYLLNHHGMVKGEVTVANLPDGRTWVGSAAAAEWHDRDWLNSHIRDDEDVHVRTLTNDHTILLLAGPKSREVLAAVSRGDWSSTAFPWLSVREAFIGYAPAVVMSVSFSGELAYEIHVPNAHLYSAYRAIRAAGDAHGLRLFGARAVESMRLEKGYLHWKSDLLTEFDPFETGLDRFVDMSKQEFVGKQALEARIAAGPQRKLVSLALDADHAAAHGGSSVMIDGKVVGTVTSGEWGYRTQLNLAYAFVEPGMATEGSQVTIDVLGDLVEAKVIAAGPYDPAYERVRS